MEFAFVEPNGELSVQKKAQYRPLTPGDLGMPAKPEGLAVELIMDGEIIKNNLRSNNLSEEWLVSALSARGISNYKDVVYACLSTKGDLFLDTCNDSMPGVKN